MIHDWARGGTVVHTDETGWHHNRKNGHRWTFGTPTERYFQYGSMVDQALGDALAGVLGAPAAGHHDLWTKYPKDARVSWARVG
jgi:hypothetical protein